MSFLDFPDDDPKRAARRPLLAFVLVTLLVGAGGSFFAQPAIPTWYAGLAHPAMAPPNWVFPPVWTALYVLMAVAAWRVWRTFPNGRRGGLQSKEMAAYGVQLALNFAWSAIFFAAHQIGLALIEIVLLLLAILATTILFFRRDTLAGLLFLPYLGWTVFAVLLTHAFWVLNS